ncbi:MAG TPA: iron-containing alcohol dehydrogenase [Anaerovoracaceae bacterium]|nr:iron-containing alcohol dehydrogenase [Anaerovoracaceae bacterium]
MKQLSLDGKGIVIGRGSLEYLKNIPFQKAMIVTGGQSMKKSGVIDRAVNYLEENGGKVSVYQGIGKNPSTTEIWKGLEIMKAEKPDLVVGIGGGSAIDAAKAMALFLEYPELNFDNIDPGNLPQERKNVKFAAVPSTSGTGTEMTQVVVYTDTEKNIKVALKTPAYKPDYAILDVDLTLTMPPNIAAETGMDALTHAIEAYTNPGLDDITEIFARGAIEGLFKWLPESSSTASVESREKVHYYQAVAGIAFANVGLGMVHGISHSYGAMYNLGHGIANAIILPYVMEYNKRDPEAAGKLRILSDYLGVKNIIEEAEKLKIKLDVPHSFQEMGLSEADFLRDFDEITDHSMLGATALNPVKMTRDEMAKMVKAVYYGTAIDW